MNKFWNPREPDDQGKAQDCLIIWIDGLADMRVAPSHFDPSFVNLIKFC